MARSTFLSIASCLALAASVAAQAGNEVVFVGSSTSGTTDLHAFVASGAPSLIASGPSAFTNNVSDAAWSDTGRSLYVAQTVSNRVSVGAWNGVGMTWSTLHQANGGCHGIAVDAARRRVWTMITPSATGELVCIDADPASATRGSAIANTSNLAGVIRVGWAAARSGNFAVVPHFSINSGLFEIVDTDPASPTFLQIVVSRPMPSAQLAGSCWVFDCQVSADELYCYVLYSGVGFTRMGVYSRAADAFLDFNPNQNGQQDLTLGVPNGNVMAVAPDRSFAVVSSGGAAGRVVRVDFDYAAPGNSSVTQFSGLNVPYANGVSLSPDGLRGAVASTAQSVGGPGKVVFFDAFTGFETATVQLGNMWNLYTTAWQDGSPNGTFSLYGSACGGSVGAPTVAPASGQRPRLGTTFTIEAGGLPYGIALLAFGTSNTSSNGVPLPLPLTGIGMIGCNLLVDSQFSAAVAGQGGQGSFALPIPANPALFQVSVYCQSFPLDPAANAFGFTASEGGDIRLGY